MLPYTYQFLISAAGTIVVEAIVFFLLIRKVFKIDSQRMSFPQLFSSSVFANLNTLPYVWYVIPILTFWNLGRAVTIGELFAFVAEAIFYVILLRLSAKRAIIASFLCNASSFVFVLPVLRAFRLLS